MISCQFISETVYFIQMIGISLRNPTNISKNLAKTCRKSNNNFNTIIIARIKAIGKWNKFNKSNNCIIINGEVSTVVPINICPVTGNCDEWGYEKGDY